MSAPVRRHLALIGLMGAGKSSVGMACAEILGWPFVDTDALIESLVGRGIADIFMHEGEHAFREYEREAVRVATEAEAAQVISCGGGVIMDPDNRARLVESSYVAWLRAEPETLARRVERSYTVRPLLEGEAPIRSLVKLAAERDPIYEEVADVAVSTDRRAVADIAASIVAAWQARL